jgi:hypothetical protein
MDISHDSTNQSIDSVSMVHDSFQRPTEIPMEHCPFGQSPLHGIGGSGAVRTPPTDHV